MQQTNSSANLPIDTRIKIAGLWTAMLFVFAYVDIFALFRVDFVEEIAAGSVAGFTINQNFLLLTTLYIVVPSLMVYLSLTLPSKINRWSNIVLAILYAASIAAGVIGETWHYYLFGSLVEVILLLLIIRHAWKWQ